MVTILSSVSTAFLLGSANVSLSGHGLFSAEILIWILCLAGFERVYREGILLVLAMIKPEWVKPKAG